MTTISAKVIADSISVVGKRLTTLQLRYPRFIHAEFMTHRAFSRNASSSRATPVEKLIQDIVRNPAVPMFWGKNRPGMQAREEHYTAIELRVPNRPRGSALLSREGAWFAARDQAAEIARAFAEAGYHKQVVNRLLEPFAHINVVVTATEWDNFFALRLHPDAEPHIQLLAQRMKEAMDASVPVPLPAGAWHTPYVTNEERDSWPVVVSPVKVSAARCARVSYLTHDGRSPSAEEDMQLYERLASSEPMHASPMEHQAVADSVDYGGYWKRPSLHRNFVGWISYRAVLETKTPIYNKAAQR